MSPGVPKARDTVVGLLLAFVLTSAAFAVVLAGMLDSRRTLMVIAALALLQVAVHLRYFLQLRFEAGSRDRWASLAFTAIVLVLMVGGTVWIMFDLHYRMMSPHRML
jgi:cytochrome o ubiquinol oxidase subunit IV